MPASEMRDSRTTSGMGDNWLRPILLGLIMLLMCGCAERKLAPIVQPDEQNVHRIRQALFGDEVQPESDDGD